MRGWSVRFKQCTNCVCSNNYDNLIEASEADEGVDIKLSKIPTFVLGSNSSTICGGEVVDNIKFTDDTYQFSISGSTITLSKYDGKNPNVVLPAQLSYNNSIYDVSMGELFTENSIKEDSKCLNSLSFAGIAGTDKKVCLSGKFAESSSDYMNGNEYNIVLKKLDITNSYKASKSSDGKVNFSGMFKGLANLEELRGMDKFDWSNSNGDLSSMFMLCGKLKKLGTKYLKNIKCTNIDTMFSDCSSMEKITLNLDASQVVYDESNYYTGVGAMFANCYSLKYINLKTLDLSKALRTCGDVEFFTYCYNLETIVCPEKINDNVKDLLPLPRNFRDSDGNVYSSAVASKTLTRKIAYTTYEADCDMSTGTVTFSSIKNGEPTPVFESKGLNMELLGYLLLGMLQAIPVTNYIGGEANVVIPSEITFNLKQNGQAKDLSFLPPTAMFNAGLAINAESANFFKDADKIESITFEKNGEDDKIIGITGAKNVFGGLSKVKTLDLSRVSVLDDEDLTGVFDDCNTLQTIKMPKALQNTTTMQNTGLNNLQSWYYVASDSINVGQKVDGTSAISAYAGHILSTDSEKNYEQLNKIFDGGKEGSNTPTTGVMLDVILPVASILLVLASLCMVAFAGKKEKLF